MTLWDQTIPPPSVTMVKHYVDELASLHVVTSRDWSTTAQLQGFLHFQKLTLDFVINYTLNMPLAGKNESLLGKRSKKDIRDFYIFKDKLGTWVFILCLWKILWIYLSQCQTLKCVWENMSAQQSVIPARHFNCHLSAHVMYHNFTTFSCVF